MALELLESADAAVTWTPPTRPAATGHTGTLVDPSGDTVSTHAVTIDDFTGTVGTVTGATKFTVTSDDTITPGQRLWWQPASGEGSVLVVSTANDDADQAVTLEGAPAGVIASGDTLHGITLSATVLAAALGDRALHYSLRWSWVRFGETVERLYQQGAHVVRQYFEDAVSVETASAEMGRLFRSTSTARESGYFTELAGRASAAVRLALQSKGSYPHLSGDPGAFKPAGRYALLVEWAHEGMRPPGHQGRSVDDMEKSLRRKVYEIADSLHWFDRDDDGVVDDGEVAQGPSAGFKSFSR